ncbi:MAG: minichromosome maintenance protein MCM [Candidatus Hydrothermarchaeota archaeon]
MSEISAYEESFIEKEDLIPKFEEFFRRYYYGAILEVAKSYPEKRSLVINCNDLDRYDATLTDDLIRAPDVTIEAAKLALKELNLPIEEEDVEINIRFENLPKKKKLRDLRNKDIETFISFESLVRKVTDIRPKLVEGVFECQRCGSEITVIQTTGQIKQPYECECGRRGPFRLMVNKSKFVDSQKLRVQESFEDLPGGEHPIQIDVFVEDDLTGVASPGDKVIVNGVLRTSVRGRRSTVFELFLEANYIEPIEQEFEELEISEGDERVIKELASEPDIYQRILDSIAPSIFGFEMAKEAIILQLFGGVPKKLPDDTKIRGDIHIFLIGDPGIAKSQLLRYVSHLAPKGIYTSGRGATGAGLTASAIKDDFGEGSWTLEAGALVLADKGIACIDEIDKMRNEDRSAMHETLEQQTVSVAKAGIMATLNARCAVLAAANPKYGRFDPYLPIADQINLPPTLLSRFDLIFALSDRPDEERDRALARHIIKVHQMGEEEIKPPIPIDLLRKYIAYSKRIKPVLTDDAAKILEDFYVKMRKKGEKEEAAISITARQLEAVIRLAEASARARLDNFVRVEDVERVIRIVEHCLKEIGIDPETGEIDIDKIMVGTTKTQRDRIKVIHEIIKELEESLGEILPVEEIIAEAENRGIDKERTKEIIEILRQRGEIFEPKRGHIKRV